MPNIHYYLQCTILDNHIVDFIFDCITEPTLRYLYCYILKDFYTHFSKGFFYFFSMHRLALFLIIISILWQGEYYSCWKIKLKWIPTCLNSIKWISEHYWYFFSLLPLTFIHILFYDLLLSKTIFKFYLITLA